MMRWIMVYPRSVVPEDPKPFREDATTSHHQTRPGTPGGRRLLVLWEGGMVQQEVPDRGRLILGRGQECDVPIDHTSVSRRHAALHIGDVDADSDGYTLEDLGSSNGTKVDERKLSAGELVRVLVGTQVRLGATTLILPMRRPVTSLPAVDAVAEALPLGPEMIALQQVLASVARGKLSVLFVGETGVGKDVLARELHRASPRANGPFLSLNCAVLGEGALEGELFGIERERPAPGLIETASGGTLLLDEVADLPLSTQGKLLRVLESGEAIRVGSVRPHRVDVRFVASTNKNLEELVELKAFRQDLYYRLNGARLFVPPLRERRTEIGPLAQRFADAAGAELGGPAVKIEPDAVAALIRHDWPGNVRELKNTIERAVLVARGKAITVGHLGVLDVRAPRIAGPTLPPPPLPAGGVAAGADLKSELGALERERILTALAQCEGNQSRAAKLLGISRRTLITRLDAHQLPRPRKRLDDDED
jgi:two-component system, NtrC family, response regulator AtoC